MFPRLTECLDAWASDQRHFVFLERSKWMKFNWTQSNVRQNADMQWAITWYFLLVFSIQKSHRSKIRFDFLTTINSFLSHRYSLNLWVPERIRLIFMQIEPYRINMPVRPQTVEFWNRNLTEVDQTTQLTGFECFEEIGMTPSGDVPLNQRWMMPTPERVKVKTFFFFKQKD